MELNSLKSLSERQSSSPFCVDVTMLSDNLLGKKEGSGQTPDCDRSLLTLAVASSDFEVISIFKQNYYQGPKINSCKYKFQKKKMKIKYTLIVIIINTYNETKLVKIRYL